MCQRRLIASMEGVSNCESRGGWLLRGTLIMCLRPFSFAPSYEIFVRLNCVLPQRWFTIHPEWFKLVGKIQGTVVRGWYGHSGIWQ